MQIISDAQLLAQIEAFLKKHDMPPTRFGREAMGDGALVSQLRAQNRSMSLKNAEKIVLYMDAYQPPAAQAAA